MLRIARSVLAGLTAAALAGCGSGGDDTMSNYGGIDGTTAPPPVTAGAPAGGAGTPATGQPAVPAPAQPATAPSAAGVPQPMKPGDPGGLTKEQLAAGVTPWDAKKQAAGAAPAGEPYRVPKGGESIYAIARKMLGSETRWKELYEANRGVVSDPEKVPAGSLIYPPLRKTSSKKFRGLTDGLD